MNQERTRKRMNQQRRVKTKAQTQARAERPVQQRRHHQQIVQLERTTDLQESSEN